MFPEPTFNSFLTLAVVLLGVGAAGLFIRRGATARLLALLVMAQAVPLALVAADRYFGTSTGRLTAALVIGMARVSVAAMAAAVLAHGSRSSEVE